SGEQLGPCEQTANSSHVAVAIAAHLVANTVQGHQAVLEWLERQQTFLQREVRPLFIGPERRWHHTVRCEHDHQSLLASSLIGESQAGQVQYERQSSRTKAKISQKLAS